MMTEFNNNTLLEEIKKLDLFKGFSKPANAYFDMDLYERIIEKKSFASQDAIEIVNSISYMFSFIIAPDSEDNPYPKLENDKLKEIACCWIYNNIERITDNIYVLSRVFDVLWICKKLKENNVKSAEKAVFLYKKCVDDCLENEDYFYASSYAKRFYGLAIKLKNSNARFCLFDSFEEYAKIHLEQKNELFLRMILQKIFNMGIDEKVKKHIVESFENAIKNRSVSEEIASFDANILFSFFRRNREYKRISDLCLSLGDYYGNLAQKEENPYRQMYFLEKAIKVLKQIEGNPFKEKIDDFYKKIQDIQPVLLCSMVEIDVPIPEEARSNIEKEYNDAFESISGELFEKDLLRFSNRIVLPRRETIESYEPVSVLSQIVPSYLVDSRGRRIRKNEAGFSFERQEYRHIYYQMSIFDVCISPMTSALNEKYNFSFTDLLPYTYGNMFVEDGQEEIYARGMYYFLKGMYIEAASLIVPIIENSLRELLKDIKSTIYMNEDGTYKEKINMQELLDACYNNKIMDNVFYYNLSEILCESNIRNDLAHGFLKSYLYSSIDVIILLAIVFKIIMFPTFLKRYGKYME